MAKKRPSLAKYSASELRAQTEQINTELEARRARQPREVRSVLKEIVERVYSEGTESDEGLRDGFYGLVMKLGEFSEASEFGDMVGDMMEALGQYDWAERTKEKKGRAGERGGQYIPFIAAWKTLRQYEVDANLPEDERATAGAYAQRVRSAIDDGDLPTKGEGRGREVHRVTFEKLFDVKYSAQETTPSVETDTGKPTEVTPVKERKTSMFPELKEKMEGRDIGELNEVFDSMNITGKQRSGYRMAYISHVDKS